MLFKMFASLQIDVIFLITTQIKIEMIVKVLICAGLGIINGYLLSYIICLIITRQANYKKWNSAIKNLQYALALVISMLSTIIFSLTYKEGLCLEC